MRSVLFLVAILLFPLVGADTDPCDHADPVLLVIPDSTGTAGGDIYVTNDLCQLEGCLFSIWIYQESNGHPGLQRDETLAGGCPNPDRNLL